ncbi:MAG: alpha/beta fold hydrolase [Anaerolineales bacterium]|nr:alpha/beta fold hydrolase [Anaerolineales bacterium]
MPALPPTQFVEHRGVRLAYQHWPGRPGAPALICLPHLTGHKGSFADLSAALSPAYAVYALDLRGRGESDRPAEGYGFAYHAGDLLACAEAWGLETFGLIGHSFGATAASYLASIRPRRVRALVLLDGGADPQDDTLRAMYPTISRLDQTYASLEAYLAAMRATPFFQPWDSALERYFTADVVALPEGGVRPRASAAAVARDLDAHFTYSLCLHFPAVRCPTLFARPALGLRGDRGHVFSETEAAAIARQIADCARVEVPTCNHYTLLLGGGPPCLPAVRAFLAARLPAVS